MAKEIALEVANSVEGFRALDERPEVMVAYTLLEDTAELRALRDKISNNGLTAGFKFSAQNEAYMAFAQQCETADISLSELPVRFEQHASIPTQPYFMKPAPGISLSPRGELGNAFQFEVHDENLWVEGFWLQSNGNQQVDPKMHLDRHNLYTANWYFSGHGVGYELNGAVVKPQVGMVPILTMHRGTGHKHPASPHRGYSHELGTARANMFATISPRDRIVEEFFSRPIG